MRRINRKVRRLLAGAISGDSRACLELGIRFWKGRGIGRDRKLARVCLKRSMELGNEEGYLIYHRLFSRGKKIIDDASYRDMIREYKNCRDEKEKSKLRKYLRLRQFLNV